jgi:hypothetical protein
MAYDINASLPSPRRPLQIVPPAEQTVDWDEERKRFDLAIAALRAKQQGDEAVRGADAPLNSDPAVALVPDSERYSPETFGRPGKQRQPTAEDVSRYSPETFGYTEEKAGPGPNASAKDTLGGIAVEAARPAARGAGGGEPQARAAFGRSDGGEMPSELVRRLSEVDRLFPQGLRSRRYSADEMRAPIGPGHSFPSEGTGVQRIINPITGGAIDLPQGADPRVYLAGVNMLAEAKAKAQADAIRGYRSEESSRARLAEALGVSPEGIGGMEDRDARTVIADRVRGRDDEAERGRDDEDRRVAREGLRSIDPDLADRLPEGLPRDEATRQFNISLQQKEDRAREAAAAEKERKGQERLSGYAGALQELESMPVEQAARVAHEKLLPFVTAGEARLKAQEYLQRAQAEAAQRDKAAHDEMKRVDAETTATRKEIKARRDAAKRSLIAPLVEAAMPASTKTMKIDHPLERGKKVDVTVPDEEKEQAVLRQAIGRVLAAASVDLEGGLEAVLRGLSEEAAATVIALRGGEMVDLQELRALMNDLLLANGKAIDAEFPE